MAEGNMYLPESGGHWYWPNGESAHYTPYAASNKEHAGELRRTTLRDARQLGLLPSVTVKLQVLAKPALQAYLINQHLYAAMTLGRGQGETDDSFIKRVLQDARVHGDEAANMGTRLHSWFEYELSDRTLEPPDLSIQDTPITLGITEWLSRNPFEVDCIEKSMASEVLRVGGRLDVVAAIPSLGIPLSVIDVKTQETLKRKDQAFWKYPEVRYQMAAYSKLDGRDLPTATIYVSRDNPGQIEVYPYPVGEGWIQFLACSSLWEDIVWRGGVNLGD